MHAPKTDQLECAGEHAVFDVVVQLRVCAKAWRTVRLENDGAELAESGCVKCNVRANRRHLTCPA